ncbi:hypothetical protein [Bradyrhizobium elkanii]
MLAQNFKSADDLEISEAQKDALIKTLVLLETGKLEHYRIPKDGSDYVPGRELEFSGHFSMAAFGRRHACGTAACIGGTAELISGVVFVGELNRPDALENLFYGDDDMRVGLEDITPSQAATALRSYLTTGHARWDLAVS